MRPPASARAPRLAIYVQFGNIRKASFFLSYIVAWCLIMPPPSTLAFGVGRLDKDGIMGIGPNEG